MALILLAQASSECATAAPHETGTPLGSVALFTPAAPASAQALVFLVSDADGWNPALDAAAGQLARHDLIVAGVDLPRWIGALGAGDGCYPLVRDFELAAKRLQRELALADYLSPVVAGVGAGGTLAYAVLAQAPAATLAGAVSLDPTPSLATPRPLCAGAPATAAANGAWAYGRTDSLPGWWRVALRTDVDPFPWAPDGEDSRTVALPASLGLGDALQRVVVAAVAEHRATPGDGPLADLPLVELPAIGRPDMLAIVVSGDGGWRDLDKSIAQVLAEKGVGVVGLDSLRYFWQARTPEGVAADLARITEHYVDEWGASPLLLIGYSFGADILPATFNRLPPAVARQVVQVSLLGISPTADFEFHVAGWFGGGASDSLPVAPEVKRLDLARVQCFYGQEETDSLCPSPVFARAERIETAGGHHFDGNYVALAARILAGAERRLELQQ